MSVNVKRVLDESKFNAFHLAVFACCLFIITIDGYDLVVYGATVPLIMKQWSLNPAQTGVIGSYALIGAAIGALLFGSLADRIGRKKTLLFCIAVFSIFNGLTGFASNPTWFSFFRLLAGFGLGGVMPNVVSLVTEYMPGHNRSMLLTMVFSGIQIGGILASALSIWLFPLAGWRSVYWVGACPLLLIPVFMAKLPETTGDYLAKGKVNELKLLLRKVNPELKYAANATFETGIQKQVNAPLASLFMEHRAFTTVMFWIVYFMNMLMIFGLGTWLPNLMMKAGYGLSSSLVFLLTLNLGAVIGCVIAGRIADNFGVKTVVTTLYFLAAVFIPLLALKTSPVLIGVLVAIAGACTLGTQNVAHAYVSQYYPLSMRSTGMGWAFGIGRIGAVVGPLLGGILQTWKVSLAVNFMAFAAAAVIAFACIALAQDQYSFVKNVGKKAQSVVGK